MWIVFNMLPLRYIWNIDLIKIQIYSFYSFVFVYIFYFNFPFWFLFYFIIIIISKNVLPMHTNNNKNVLRCISTVKIYTLAWNACDCGKSERCGQWNRMSTAFLCQLLLQSKEFFLNKYFFYIYAVDENFERRFFLNNLFPFGFFRSLSIQLVK